MSAKKTIWKYELEPGDNDVLMPEGAEILSVQMQGQSLCLWAIVSPWIPKQRRTIEIVGTGHLMNDEERNFIGTVQMEGGSLVWHIFEKP